MKEEGTISVLIPKAILYSRLLSKETCEFQGSPRQTHGAALLRMLTPHKEKLSDWLHVEL